MNHTGMGNDCEYTFPRRINSKKFALQILLAPYYFI